MLDKSNLRFGWSKSLLNKGNFVKENKGTDIQQDWIAFKIYDPPLSLELHLQAQCMEP